MEDIYEIVPLQDMSHDFLIIATSYENPLGFLTKIGMELQADKAKLLFDLTLINGLSSNRYIQCDYDAASDRILQCSVVENVDGGIQEISRAFFASHEDLVKKSPLPEALKFLLLSNPPLLSR